MHARLHPWGGARLRVHKHAVCTYTQSVHAQTCILQKQNRECTHTPPGRVYTHARLHTCSNHVQCILALFTPVLLLTTTSLQRLHPFQ